MKRIGSWVLGTLILASVVAGCQPAPAAKEASAPTASTALAVQTGPGITTLAIKGMTCGSCVDQVHKTLSACTGVKGADVSGEQALAVVRFDPAKTSPESIRAYLESKTEYTATVAKAP